MKKNVSVNEVKLLKQVFLEIPGCIEGVLSVEWGVNNSPENKNKGCSHCVFMTFKDEIARDNYLLHPEHVKLKNIFLPLLNKIIVLDYQKTSDGYSSI